MDIKLPELGEGIESGDVLSVLVSEGDSVEKDQGLIELETDKASVEIPSTRAGKETKIHVREGDTLNVGGVIVSLDTADSAADEAPPEPKPADEKEQDKKSAQNESQDEGDAASVQADEDDAEESPSEERQPAAQESDERPKQPPPKPPAEKSSKQVSAAQVAQAHTLSAERADNGETVPAGPAMRRFAREVGVDLHHVQGTGEGGRITRGDVLRVVRGGSQKSTAGASSDTTATQTFEHPPQPKLTIAETEPAEAEAQPPGDQARDDWGLVRIVNLPKIRRTIAHKMHESWSTIPRVTNYDDADVTELEQVRQASKSDYATAGIKLTQMPFVIKACAMALRANPTINASIDLENGQVIYKQYVNIGIAVDTERGLVVPSLRNADKLAIPDIARALAALAENVRTGKFGVEDLRGSTFTISNLGAIGGTYSTPIINPPEVAILLLGRSRKMPVVVDHQFAVRLQLPLSLSYDHRLVDGAAAARFLNDIKGFLQSPSRLLLAP